MSYMVRLRLHPRLNQRLDESDVVQEAFFDAACRLQEFTSQGSITFFLWLRQITAHKLIDLHRRHLGASRRDIRLEVALPEPFPSAMSASLAAQLLAGISSPSSAAAKAETQRLVQEALESMHEIDREVLALRHFERLSNAETAHVLQVSESACSNRYVRALGRLKQIIKQIPGLS
jgi:RNA polymerase sigma-70 factor (ECF subfamily)